MAAQAKRAKVPRKFNWTDADGVTHVVTDKLPKKLGLRPLNSGCYRVVYALGDDYVLKVPVRTNGSPENSRLCNLIEAELWASVANTSYAAYLAEVVACPASGAWQVMRRVHRNYQDYSKKPHKAARDLSIYDLHDGNYIGSTIVDYAGTECCYDGETPLQAARRCLRDRAYYATGEAREAFSSVPKPQYRRTKVPAYG